VNTLTTPAASFDFSTLEELKAIVRGMPGREGVTQLWRDGLTLCGYDAIPVMHVIGTTREPVRFLGLQASQRDKHEP
jgi:hypothetical protein